MGERLRCGDCGRRWTPAGQDLSALGVRVRRTVRHAGWKNAWSDPRPANRCPSCGSKSMKPDAPAHERLEEVATPPAAWHPGRRG